MQAHGHLSEAQSAVRQCEGDIKEAEEQAKEVLEKMSGLRQQEEEKSMVSGGGTSEGSASLTLVSPSMVNTGSPRSDSWSDSCEVPWK